jgi:hypothetical protein
MNDDPVSLELNSVNCNTEVTRYLKSFFNLVKECKNFWW